MTLSMYSSRGAGLLLMFGLLLICSTVVAGVVHVLTARYPPTVTVEGGTIYEVGQTNTGQIVAHIFRLYNPHPYPIRVAIVTPGCTCTTAKTDRTTILPYENASVTVSTEAEQIGDLNAGADVYTERGNESKETWLLITGSVVKKTHKISPSS